MMAFEMFPRRLRSSSYLCARTLELCERPVDKISLDLMSFTPKKLLNISKTALTNSLNLLQGERAVVQQIGMDVSVIGSRCKVLFAPSLALLDFILPPWERCFSTVPCPAHPALPFSTLLSAVVSLRSKHPLLYTSFPSFLGCRLPFAAKFPGL